MKGTIAIIDGNSLMNRAFYAMRNPMITKEGIYTQGIFGFINMLDKIKKDYEPTHMAVAFDLKAPTFRHLEYDEYKAGRRKMPPELAMEFPILKDILEAMNIKQVELGGFEADDLIGTIAKRGEEAGLSPVIITGDKDALQLATDVTKIIYTKRGVSDFDVYDREAMLERYGLTPEQFIDLKGLMGDTSDNIPGIPGIGEKTDTKLLLQFGSVENLIAHADEVTPKGVRAKVEENVQLAVMSKRLATINTNVPIDIDLEEYRLTEPDYDRLIDIYTKLEFNRFLKKLRGTGEGAGTGTKDTVEAALSAGASGAGEVRLIHAEDYAIKVIRSEEELKEIQLTDETVLKVFGNYDHLRLPEIDGICLLSGENFYFVDAEAAEGIFQFIAEADTKFVGHGLKRDYYMIMTRTDFSPDTAFDTEIAQYVLDSGRSDYSLQVLSNEYLHAALQSEEEFRAEHGQLSLLGNDREAMAEYGLKVCTSLENIRRLQQGKITEEGLDTILYDIELPLIQVMAGMEKEGFKADRNYLVEFGETLSSEIDQLTSEIHQLAGEEFNIKSTQQLGDILFEKLELPAGKKTKRGYSTSAEILEKIKDKHPIVPKVLEYRTLTKLKSTYVDGMLPLIGEDGKIRAHFNQTVTTTGRISCTEPNLQNIPVRQELGRKLRQAFVPDGEGSVLVGADYSQIELRVLAHMSQDEALIGAFERGEDIHRATAANVLGVDESEVTPLDRSRAKAVNFGVIYGMSAFGLSTELHITRKDADEYISAYFAKHPDVRRFMDEQVELAKEQGFVKTMMGRKRYIKEIKASQYMVRQIGERLAMNTPIQGTAADIIKIAMIKVYKALSESGLKSRLILQVHDELIINTYEGEREAVEKLLVENMESACEMSVKLKADLNEGANWYALK
ncbi:MAG: DNA polymerase I [Firmicutes bacterium]|nr:DNA polymerase I [Bacillota bacterium]